MRCPKLLVAGSIAVLSAVAPVGAQATSADDQAEITVVVIPFDFAAPLPATHAPPPRRSRVWPPILGQPVGGIGERGYFASRLAHGAGAAPSAYPATREGSEGAEDALGIGVADLLVERLLTVPGFRIVERRRLDQLLGERRLGGADSVGLADTSLARGASTMLRARYLITGSITRFGTEDRRGLGGLGGAFGLGALGIKRPKTQVALTARVVDAVTGEIVASVSASGVSTKGGGILVAGVGGGLGGGVAVGSNEFRESALGEATQKAVEGLAQALVAQRARMR